MSLIHVSRSQIITVDSRPAANLTIGQSLLVGALSFETDGMGRAALSWLLHEPRKPQPARQRGRILRIHISGNFGEIGPTEGAGGKRWFFHRSQLRPIETITSVGQVVTFREIVNDRGPTALDVRRT